MDNNISVFEKIRLGLAKTRNALFGGVFDNADIIDDDFFDDLEERMILADIGMETSSKLISLLMREVKLRKITKKADAKNVLIDLIISLIKPQERFIADSEPAVLLVVGVNGVGKTTSIGKIANYYRNMGHKPMLAAADTFRAAAAEQLELWAERCNVPIVKHQEGADPAAVTFDAIASYRAKQCDLLFVDTAGRLHNKANLMNELAKIRRVIDRELPGIPCETLLVLDATTGQNAVAQAKAFADVTGLSGIILTKLDGTAKGGVVISIASELSVPIRFIGLGEGIDDVKPFDPRAFAEALF